MSEEHGVPEPHRVITVDEPDIGLEATIVIDSVRDELTAGGIRRASYPDGDAAEQEARRLARAMTLKCRAADLPSGGAKTVIRDTDELDLEAAYRRLGEAIDELEPPYLCGPDLGTGPDELAHVRKVTDRVNPASNAPARATAVGVLAGLQAALETATGTPSASGRTALVQGYGSVGRKIAHGLLDQGAKVLVTDTDDEAREAAEDAGLTTVDPQAWPTVDADVLLPCATGGLLTPETASTLKVDAVCGSANNPLSSPKAGEILHERGIVYAPDVLVNTGAIIEGVLTWREGDNQRVRDEVDRKISGIYERTIGVLEAAQREDVPPETVVQQRWG